VPTKEGFTFTMDLHDDESTPFNVRSWRAPCKGGAFQWVQARPGNRSSQKQPEQSWR
jgi:hypothetical protein